MESSPETTHLQSLWLIDVAEDPDMRMLVNAGMLMGWHSSLFASRGTVEPQLSKFYVALLK